MTKTVYIGDLETKMALIAKEAELAKRRARDLKLKRIRGTLSLVRKSDKIEERNANPTS